MAIKPPKNGRAKRRHDATGRTIPQERFVQLRWNLMESPAWKSMKCEPKQIYVELRRRFTGWNNGELYYSVRDAANELHMAKDTAMRGFRELESKGFIKCAQRGSFHYKKRHASTWVLTEENCGEQLPTRDYARWQPKTEAGPKSGQKCPKSRPPTRDSEPS